MNMPGILKAALAATLIGLGGCVVVIGDEGISHERDAFRFGDDHRHGERGADRSLAAQVHDALSGDPLLRDLDLSVKAEDRVVTLRGRVPDIATFDRVVSLARGTAGVDKVVSRLVVEVH